MSLSSFDVVIVGAGFAGACAAHVIAGQGRRVLLIDRRFEWPDLFRAEKVEPDQARIMRELGLLELRAPNAPPVGRVLNFDGRTSTEFDTREQYGICYGDTVNRLIECLPPSVETLEGRVSRLSSEGARPEVELDDGTLITAKVIVVATGGSDALISTLGLERRRRPSLRSLSFGFDLDCDLRGLGGYSGFNYFLPPSPTQIDYLTIFPIGRRLRANLFTRMEPKDPIVRRFKEHPRCALEEHFPGLAEQIGDYSVSTKLQVVPTTYSRLKKAAKRGIVVIGEEFQSVSPTTGMGLTRILTDVQALTARHLPRWLESRDVSSHDVRTYYRDPQKMAADRRALGTWLFYRDRPISGRMPLGSRIRTRLQLMEIGLAR